MSRNPFYESKLQPFLQSIGGDGSVDPELLPHRQLVYQHEPPEPAAEERIVFPLPASAQQTDFAQRWGIGRYWYVPTSESEQDHSLAPRVRITDRYPSMPPFQYQLDHQRARS